MKSRGGEKKAPEETQEGREKEKLRKNDRRKEGRGTHCPETKAE